MSQISRLARNYVIVGVTGFLKIQNALLASTKKSVQNSIKASRQILTRFNKMQNVFMNLTKKIVQYSWRVLR